MTEQEQTPSPDPLAERLALVAGFLQQGDSEAAMALCDELIRAYPNDPAVNAALGEVYSAELRWAEAAEWYRRAQELGGDEQIAQQLEYARQQAAHRHPAASRPAPPPLAARPARRTSWGITFVLLGVALLVMLGAVVLIVGGLRARRAGRPSPPISSAGAAIPPGPPAAAQQPSAESETAAPPAAPTEPFQGAIGSQQINGPTVARAPVVIVRRNSGPFSDRDFYLTEAIGSLTWPGGRPLSRGVSVVLDPVISYAIVTFEIPNDLSGQSLQETVVRQCFQMATIAFRTDPGLDHLSFRGLSALRGTDNQIHTVVTFRGDTSRQVIQDWPKTHPVADFGQIWREAFTAAWWNPGLTGENQGAQP